MKANFVSYAKSQGRDPQSIICIAINASNQHVRHVAEVCRDDKVFVVDQSSEMNKAMSQYMNDIMCGDVKGNQRC